MNVIDVTTVADTERHVIVIGQGGGTLFRGPESEARERYPHAFRACSFCAPSKSLLIVEFPATACPRVDVGWPD